MTTLRSPRLLALPCLLLVAACGPHARLDVTMRGVSITVPRVLAPAMALVPPPSIPVPAALPLPPLPLLPPVAPPTVGLPAAQPPAPACPVAGPFAAPDKPASFLVTGPPASGTMIQTSKGSYAGSPTATAAGSLAGTVKTTVAALPSSTSPAGQRLDAWSVIRTDTVTHASSIEVYQLVGPSSTANATTPGLYLTGLSWNDPVRGPLSFQPTGGGVEIMPLPVAIASADAPQYASSQTDPATGTTLSLAGEVQGRSRVDVCGKVVDTFTVLLTGALVSPSRQHQVSWRMQIATQYGGVPVEDQLALNDPSAGFTWDRTLRDTTVPGDPK